MTYPEQYENVPNLRARFRGCLLGGAVGDALGGPVEFLSLSEIITRYGAPGVKDYEHAWGGKGKITDDTQMTLFTAEGLLRAWTRASVRGIGPAFTSVTAHAYLRWLLTQGERNRHDLLDTASLSGWLIRHEALFHPRAPGATCLTALREMRAFGEPARNHSKGCGGVMRVGPVGLFYVRYPEQDGLQAAFDTGCQLAALTHGHPTGYLTGGVLAALIFQLVKDVPLETALDGAVALLVRAPGHDETRRVLERARELAGSPRSAEEPVSALGEGWVAEEALAIAVYCALRARSFEEGVLMAVNHSGDSDSTGAIAGNLLGAMYGLTAIPEHWQTRLELNAVIQEMADDLLAYRDWQISDYDDTPTARALREKYPGD
ncbi:NrtR-regulated ADP-ribosyl-glycohydrolase DraG [Cronobacter condimenti 1330]|uniref:ADP-ribosylglycohydrolase n=1 Tax=Cronobacter condimenti 1330 TaxID=1073999 RepID=K8A833_9ENTR|nr:ADP-ribosylglycohydrolase family protein [Cronobacter condimenti]ALB63958.1 ADP-ribosylglycohydrolase [Cronobacter condimenti 1330]CCJ71904.1 NrtR-regulated ADP-ribosyl-glycohydrolase DraG [Cronobacter condimenti 1330]